MESLPPPEEQEALLEALAGHIADAGHDRFVAAPLIEPSARYFPDPWEASAEGVTRLLRRLLRYAGLDDQLWPDVELVDDPEDLLDDDEIDGDVDLPREQLPLVVFRGIEDGLCFFRVDAQRLDDADLLLGALVHEVSGIFRFTRDLDVDDGALAHRLIDLTSVWLGFGVLATNASLLHRTSGEIDGSWVSTSYKRAQLGALAPQSFAFLLAVQTVVRGMSLGPTANLLEPNQAAFFHAAHRRLEPQADALIERLGLPPKAQWPAPAAPDLAPLPPPSAAVQSALEALEADDDDDAPHGYDDERPRRRRPVFRVRARPLGTSTMLGVMGGAVIAMAVWSVAPALHPAVLVVLGAGPMLLGVGAGIRLTHDRCSDPDCMAMLPPHATSCPACGGYIAGRIRSADERLDAEERYLRASR